MTVEIKVGKVAMVDIDSVQISDRARKEMGDLDGLENNMKESGLISPLAVVSNPDGTYNLLAGERRYTVLKRNEIKEIPVRIYEEGLSELEIKIIEKSENFFRKDFEYWELDALTAEIHCMQQALYGVKAPGPSQTGWGAGNTAEMIGAKAVSTVTDAIKRANAREKFPELFETCRSAADASKVLKKINETVIRAELAKKISENKSDNSIQDLSNRYVIKDFFVGVKEIPDDIIHLIEVDPPYGIDLKDIKNKKDSLQQNTQEYNEVPAVDYPEFLYRLLKECYRVAAPHSWLIFWFAPEPWFNVVYDAIKRVGFSTTRMCGIWTKSAPGQNLNPTTRLSNSYEMFFYAWKGNPVLNKAGVGNDFRCPPVPSDKKSHPTERPVELMKGLYETFAIPGSRILIPFLGSGNGLLAAHELGMSASGFELTKSYKDSFLVKSHLMMKK